MPNAALTDAVAFHSQIASDFNDSYKADPNRLERLAVWRACLARHVPAKVSSAYDIGCGSGALTAEIAPLAERVTAIDGSAAMLALAERDLAAKGFGHLRFREARLPIADTSELPPAPLVISSSVIEYLTSLEEAVTFLKALTAPGGMIVFSISNGQSINRAIVRLVHQLTGRPRYFGLVLHFVDEPQVRALLAGAGLEFVEIGWFGGEDQMNRFFRLFLPRRFATNMVLVVARRPTG